LSCWRCPSAKKLTFEQTKTDKGNILRHFIYQMALLELLAPSVGKEADLTDQTDSGTFKGILYIQWLWHLFELLAPSFGKEANL
jgi:hypothetical protein